MRSIDERIVEMRFDNKHFETNVQTSLRSLDKLKSGLQLDKSAESLSNLSKVSRGFSLSPITNAAELVSSRLSTMGIAGITAIQRMTNIAIDCGARMFKALAIDPIKTGFNEYETQINSVQTILANTQKEGATLKDVNATLDELNQYADKTIYNFTEMTRNIGTFTAAGVDLKTSTSAIKGIANLAAISGSTSQQASTAMYQLSQALASGTVKLMDWNSVVNAGMGGQVFQDALKETARVHGIKIDEMIKKQGSFRETLQEGWLTSSILTETLSKFTGDLTEEQLLAMGYTKQQTDEILKLGQTANDAATKVKTFTQLFDTLKEAAQSGWSQSWKIIVGDFEEAKSLLTMISDAFSKVIGDAANSRNVVLQQWKDLGGRTKLIESFKNTFSGLSGILKAVKKAFKSIFPSKTGKDLKRLTDGIHSFTEKLKNLLGFESKTVLKIIDTSVGRMGVTDEIIKLSPFLDKISRIFKGLFAIVDMGGDVLGVLVSKFAGLLGFVGPTANGILDFLASIGDSIVNIRNFLNETNFFEEKLNNIGETVKGFFKPFIYNSEDGTNRVAEFFKKIKEYFAGFETIKDETGKTFSTFWGTVTSALSAFGFDDLFTIINGSLLAAGLIGLKKFISGLLNVVGDGEGLFGKFGEIFDGIKESLKAWQSELQSNALIKIAGAVLGLAFAVTLLSAIDAEKLKVAMGAITGLFVELIGSLAAFSKVTSGIKGGLSLSATTGAMIGLSVSVLILAAAMKTMADLEWDSVIKGISGILGVVAILAGAAAVMSKTGRLSNRGSLAFILLGAAVHLFVGAIEKFKDIDTDTIKRGIVGLGLIMLELIAFSKLTQGANFSGMEAGLAILGLAVSVFVDAISKFTDISWDTIGKGLIGIAGLLTVLGVFTLFTRTAKGVITTSIGLAILGGAVHIFISAIKGLEEVSWDTIGKGLTSISGLLLAFGLFTRLAKGSLGNLVNSISFVILGAGIHLFVSSIKKMADIPWDAIGKGAVAMGSLLTIFGIFNTLFGGRIGTILNSVGLVLFGLAGELFTHIIGKFGDISLNSIGKALLAIGGMELLFAAIGMIPITASLAAIGNLGIALGGITGIIAIAGAISSIPGFDWLITKGGEALGLVGSAIGKFIQGIFNPNGAAATSESEAANLTGIGNSLSSFMTAIEPFLTSISGMDSSALANVTSVADTIAALVSAAQNLNASPGAGATLTSFAADLKMFGSDMASYADSVSKIDQKAITNSSNAIEILSDMARDIPNTGGLLAFFAGDNNIADFGADLVSFGTSISSYASSISDVDNKKVTASANAAKALAEFANNLPDSGGLKQKISGEKDILTFAQGIAELGPSLKTYANSVKGMNTTSVNASASAAKVLAEFANNVPNSGGIIQWIQGEKDIKTFADGIAALGPSLKTYIDSVAGLKTEDVDNSISALTVLTSFASGLENKGGVLQGIANFFTGDNDINTFAQDLVDFGSKMSTFASYFGESSNISTSVDNASAVVSQLKELFSGDKTTVSYDFSVFTSLLDGILSTLTLYYPDYYDVGGTLGSNIINGFASQRNALVSVISAAISSGNKAVRSYYNAFYNSGYYIVAGLASGIRDNASAAINAAASVASAALSAANSALDIASPSGAFEESGMWSMKGLAIGFIKNIGFVTSAAKTVGSNLMETMGLAVSGLADVINSDMDVTPTIRPVLDLTDVAYGAQAINGLLSRQTIMVNGISTQGLARNVGSTATGFDQNGNHNGSPDVVNAIHELNVRINEMSDAITHMKIVLDSGAMVGQMETEMNRRLGVQMTYAERRI